MKLKIRGRSPSDVVLNINGQNVTVGEIKENRRRHNQRQLDWKRRSFEPYELPAFVWVFYNPHFIYMGWWLYVRTRVCDFGINFNRHYIADRQAMIQKIMTLYPMDTEDFETWCQKFVEVYPKGVAPVRAVLSYDDFLLDVRPLVVKTGDYT